ncbi:hypothetical protein Ato02nite_021600 [Paractinoplanes toevensis]|uniref:Uncharacterized protein n=1 Tax=Paractinoplanes toevensis TaxID=571911 RepID=A0A919T7Z6_9ACTN|nr:hypothetical protein Ato02nite_021600 [Actinoplanes toevensis]
MWKPVWQPPQARSPEVMPVDSLHGPPGLTPQCRAPKTELRPLMSSMMSISPDFGQVTPDRSGAPSIQNAGQ